MNYQRHYDQLIARSRNRHLEGYSERHHVVPRCIGGDDSPENIVRLTPEEHYVAHQLLVKMHPGNHRLVWAASAMAGGSERQSGRQNKLYGWLRRKFAETVGDQTRGIKRSDEAKAKMAAAKLGKKRGPFTAEHKAKIAAAHIGRVRGPQSQERRARTAEAMTRGMLKVWEERQAGLRPMPPIKAKGVHYEKHAKRWRARIRRNKKTVELGLYDTEAEAAEVYRKAVEEYNRTLAK